MSKFDKAMIGLHDLESPALIHLPRGVRLLHVEALAWCSLRRTDGVLAFAALPRATDEPDAMSAAAQLVAAGVWEETPTGWRIVGYLDTQISASEIALVEARNRANWRRQKAHQRCDHALCNPARCSQRADKSADTRVDRAADARRTDLSVPARTDALSEQVGTSPGALASPPKSPVGGDAFDFEPEYAVGSTSFLEKKLRWQVERARREQRDTGKVSPANARLAAKAREELELMGRPIEPAGVDEVRRTTPAEVN
jgi:hypothetical protein